MVKDTIVSPSLVFNETIDQINVLVGQYQKTINMSAVKRASDDEVKESGNLNDTGDRHKGCHEAALVL